MSGSSGTLSPDEQARWRRHLSECRRCTEFMDRYRLATERLLTLPRPGEIGSDCPGPGKWAEFAAGFMDDESSAEFLDHVIDCDACGKLLKLVVQPEPELRAPAPSLSAAFIRDTARKAAAEAHPKKSGPKLFSEFWKPAVIFATIAAIAVIAFLIMKPRNPGPETLVARAYEQNRTWPIRMPGAEFLPADQQRGSQSHTNTALAEAETAVSRGLDQSPKDSRLIGLQSRIDLVRHRYSEAISPLEALVDSGNTSASVLLDLGSAHLARGLADRNAADLDTAVDQLGRVLSSEPANQIALFNRAVALEELLLIDRAIDAWTKYLAADSTSAWAQEARSHLQRLREKKKSGSGA